MGITAAYMAGCRIGCVLFGEVNNVFAYVLHKTVFPILSLILAKRKLCV
jgi:hypothetical protein